MEIGHAGRGGCRPLQLHVSEAVIDSPCIKVCILDGARRVCTGCGRTLEEIARWSRMTIPERAAVMARLRERPPSPPHHISL
ncbi:MAG: DUF1289 domain-containing protein [Sphingobium sp.]